MNRFTSVSGLLAPLLQDDIDTDQIIPKQFLKGLQKTGLGPALFHDWRFLPSGEPQADFILNQPVFNSAVFLLAGKNFGCGSSREHAVWALMDFGFRAILAPSFATIFTSNALQNGLLLIPLPPDAFAEISQLAMQPNPLRLTIDLKGQVLTTEGAKFSFSIDEFTRKCLLNGYDSKAITLTYADAIAQYEATRPAWLPSIPQKP